MKNFTKQLQKNDKFIATARGARTIWRVGTIVAPAAACGYLMVRYNDIIVTALAVLLGLYSVSQLIKSAWLAEGDVAKK